MGPKWKPSKTELAQFARINRAAMDPGSFLDDFKAGRVTKEAVETVRDLYPEIYAQVTNELIGRMGELQKLPYAERLQLSTLFDVPLDATMEPAFLASVQMFQPTAGGGGDQGMLAPSPGGRRSAPRVKGIDSINPGAMAAGSTLLQQTGQALG
jgi:hypothetical protein